MLASFVLSNPVIVTGACGVVTGVLGTLTLNHLRTTHTWNERVRRTDEDTADLAGPVADLAALYAAQSALARTPCHAADFAEVTRIANRISGREYTPDIQAEFDKVLERAQAYINTALPEPAPTTRLPLATVRTQMAQAMAQEAARIALERVINAADQKTKTLYRV